MKKLYSLVIVMFLISCSDNVDHQSQSKYGIESRQIKGNLNKRIFCKEITIINGERYRILEVDGIEYLTTSYGGIVPLVKNKDNNVK